MERKIVKDDTKQDHVIELALCFENKVNNTFYVIFIEEQRKFTSPKTIFIGRASRVQDKILVFKLDTEFEKNTIVNDIKTLLSNGTPENTEIVPFPDVKKISVVSCDQLEEDMMKYPDFFGIKEEDIVTADISLPSFLLKKPKKENDTASNVTTEATTPVQPTAPVEVQPPVQPTAPVEVQPPVQPTAPVEVQPPVQPTAPVEVQPPVQPTAPVEVQPPVQPTAPVEVQPPVQPTAPVEVQPPVQPTAPVKVQPPVQPTAPVEVQPPVQPTAPVEVQPPVQPTAPVEVQPPVPPKETKKKKGGNKTVLILASVAIIIVIAVVVVVFYFMNSKSKEPGNNNENNNPGNNTPPVQEEVKTYTLNCEISGNSPELDAVVTETKKIIFDQNKKLKSSNSVILYKFTSKEAYQTAKAAVDLDNELNTEGYTIHYTFKDEENYYMITIGIDYTKLEEGQKDIPDNYDEAMSFFLDKGYTVNGKKVEPKDTVLTIPHLSGRENVTFNNWVVTLTKFTLSADKTTLIATFTVQNNTDTERNLNGRIKLYDSSKNIVRSLPLTGTVSPTETTEIQVSIPAENIKQDATIGSLEPVVLSTLAYYSVDLYR